MGLKCRIVHLSLILDDFFFYSSHSWNKNCTFFKKSIIHETIDAVHLFQTPSLSKHVESNIQYVHLFVSAEQKV